MKNAWSVRSHRAPLHLLAGQTTTSNLPKSSTGGSPMFGWHGNNLTLGKKALRFFEAPISALAVVLPELRPGIGKREQTIMNDRQQTRIGYPSNNLNPMINYGEEGDRPLRCLT